MICIFNIEKNLKQYYKMIFLNSEIIYKNVLSLKELLNNKYEKFQQNYSFFNKFNKNISKPSSIYPSLFKIIEEFDQCKENQNKYILIISDGNIRESHNYFKELKIKVLQKDIKIVTIFLSETEDNNDNEKKKLYYSLPEHLENNENVKKLFNISSNVDYKNPLAHLYIKEDYNFPTNGRGKLFLRASIPEINKACSLTGVLNEVKNEGIEIKICDLNYNNFEFKYNFATKNQIFGTCWSNAYSAAIFLTNKRILGRKIESFETIRENLIRIACNRNEDGGNVRQKNVLDFFKSHKLNCEEINVSEAKKCIMKGRFVICAFWLWDTQWTNFGDFFKENPDGILEEKILNRRCAVNSPQPDEGHAVLLIEIGNNYLKFLNSWGSNFAHGGTFKIRNINALTSYGKTKPIFYDVYYCESDLRKEEKDYYEKNIVFIRNCFYNLRNISHEGIKEHMNNIYESSYSCKKCTIILKLDEYEIYKNNGIYEILCPICKSIYPVDDLFKEYLLLNDLMNDGSNDFNINNKEEDLLIYMVNINII